MKAVVTGSAGFCGRHVVRVLEDAGYDVTGVDRGGGGVAEFAETDGRYDLVVHCAAFLGGREAIESPLAHAVNLETDAMMFRWAERTRPGRLVYFSSVAAYPAYLQYHGGRRLREDDIDFRWGGLTGAPHRLGMPDQLYGWAKLSGEYMATRLACPAAVVRPFTVYGAGQGGAYPFGNILGQVLGQADPVTVWGSGRQVRDWIHVSDVAAAVLACAREGFSGPLNLCTGRGVALGEMALMAAREAGYSPALGLLRDKPEGLPYRVGDPGRLEGICPPKVSLEEGIRRCLEAARDI